MFCFLAKSEESWESPKQVKKKKKARRETWTSKTDMCCWILSWRLCCLCNNLWTCTEFYINFKQFLKTELLWTQTSLKRNRMKVTLWYSKQNMLHLKDILKSLFFQLLERDLNLKKTGFTTQCPVYNRLYSHLPLRIKD